MPEELIYKVAGRRGGIVLPSSALPTAIYARLNAELLEMSDVQPRSNAIGEEALPTRGPRMDPAGPIRRRRRPPAARAWCFTENDPENSKFLRAEREGLEVFATRVRFLVFQLERGEEGQHDHYQGYLELAKSQPLSWVRNQLSNTAHWEIRQGTP